MFYKHFYLIAAGFFLFFSICHLLFFDLEVTKETFRFIVLGVFMGIGIVLFSLHVLEK